MRILFVTISLLFAHVSLYADSIVIYSTETNRCLVYRPSQDPSPYLLRPDVLIFNDQTTQTETQVQVLLATTSIIYFMKSGSGQIIEMTPNERAQFISEMVAASILRTRTRALMDLVLIGSSYARDRGIVILTKDEINILRQWITAFKVEVSSATSLNDLKTRVGKLPNLPDRTAQQAKTALENIITAGQAD